MRTDFRTKEDADMCAYVFSCNYTTILGFAERRKSDAKRHIAYTYCTYITLAYTMQKRAL